MIKSRRKKYSIQSSSLFLFLGMLLISGIALIRKKNQATTNEHNSIPFGMTGCEDGIRNDKFPYVKIKMYVRKCGGNDRLSKIILAHAIVETGNFSSGSYKNCNNCFGMGRVYSRNNHQCGYKDYGVREGEPKYFGCYTVLLDSVLDLFDWWAMHKYSIEYLNSLSLYQYLDLMKRRKYYVIPLKDYYPRVKSVYSKL